MNKRYTIVEHINSSAHAIKLLEAPFDGIIYSYGKVTFDEEDENDLLHINFEYEILDNADKGMSDLAPFETYIGKILEELIHISLENKLTVYKGGVDENRTEDSE
jgi:hypothetical protein